MVVSYNNLRKMAMTTSTLRGMVIDHVSAHNMFTSLTMNFMEGVVDRHGTVVFIKVTIVDARFLIWKKEWGPSGS